MFCSPAGFSKPKQLLSLAKTLRICIPYYYLLHLQYNLFDSLMIDYYFTDTFDFRFDLNWHFKVNQHQQFYLILMDDPRAAQVELSSRQAGRPATSGWQAGRHSSEIRGLRSTKCSSATLQNLLYFMYKKTHVVFFVFHFVQLNIFTQ